MGGVFISHRSIDSRGYDALLYQGLVVRFGADLVFLDAESIPVGEDYVQELLARVRSASVVLVVIGPEWLTAVETDGGRAIDDPRDWVRRELVEAFSTGVRVVPVLIDDAVLPIAADLPGDIAGLSRCQARYLRHRESVKDLERLAAGLAEVAPELAAAAQVMAAGPQEILNQVEGDVSGSVVQTGAISGGLHFHLPATGHAADAAVRRIRKLPADTGVFVGRDRELIQLTASTGESDRVAVVAVHGLGGVGKSTVAARFAHLNADRFAPVWWVAADSQAAIDTGLADLAVVLDPSAKDLPADQRHERAIVWLAGRTGWLLVLDNLTTPADAQPLLERVQTGTILITSRCRGGWRDMTALSLDVLSPVEAADLLTRIAHVDWADADMRGADRLCEELGWLPLAIEQAGAYLAQNRISPVRYLALLAEFPARMFSATAEGGDAQRTMSRVWHVTLDRLTDTPLAGRLLRQLAWFAPGHIPRFLLERPEYGPDATDALGRLAAYHMITLTAGDVGVHRLVQAVTRTPDPGDCHRLPDDIAHARDTTAATLARVVQDADPFHPTDWANLQTVLPHTLWLFAHTDAEAGSAAHGILAHLVGNYLRGQGRPRDAIALHALAVAYYERLHGADHSNALNSRNSLASAYEAAGDLDLAIPLFETLLADLERLQGVDHPDTLAVRNNLAGALRTAGNIGRAIPLIEKTAADRARVEGADHPDTMKSQSNAAFALQAAGRLNLAIPLFEKSLADRERVLGADHPDTLTSQNNLGDAYVEAGDPARAIPLLEKAIAGRKRVLGADHPDTLTSRNNLGFAYQAAGDLDRAIPLLKESLDDQERVLGADHPDTLNSRNNLAFGYQAAGDLWRAITLFTKTFASRKRVLGADHPDTLMSQNNVANTYRTAGNLGRAIPLLERALADTERALGAEHPISFTARNNLACAYLDGNDVDRAIPLLESTVADQKRTLGTDHPGTLHARNNLANAYAAAGDRARAVSLLRITLADADRILGHSDSATKTIRSNLTAMENPD